MNASHRAHAFSKNRLFSIALVGIAVIAIVSGLRARPSEAVPVFTKAYGGVDCSTCHASGAVPLLNAYGRYIQRTGYAAIDHKTLESMFPVTIAEEVQYDSQNQPPKVQPGNLALHATGYLGKDLTYHIHQWLYQFNKSGGGLDTFQLAYSGLFKGNGHLFVGKLSALPVPGPFSNTPSDIFPPYGPAEITVGEHMYQSDMMRWGTAFSYVHAPVFFEAGWLGSGADWNGATDFSNDTEKTFEWTAAYADPGKPIEAGLFGSIGTFPLAEGGIDSYHSIAAYVQRDPGPHRIPGFFAVYQRAYDGNPGNGGMSGMGAPAPSAAASSSAYSAELYESFFQDRAVLGLRKDMTNDGLGNVSNFGDVWLAIEPIPKLHYLHLYLDTVLTQNGTPDFKASVWWASPLSF